MELKQGCLDDFKCASADRNDIVLRKKDFSNQTISRVKIGGGVISQCAFVEDVICGCVFENVNFVSEDFTKAYFCNVKFIRCVFHECKLDSASFEDTIFEECKVLNCTFDNVDLSVGVSGLDVDDQAVILEDSKLVKKASQYLTGIGLEADAGAFNLSSDNGELMLSVAFDPENGENALRMMLFEGDVCRLSDTYELDADSSELEVFVNIQGFLTNSRRVISFQEDDLKKQETFRENIDNIINKIKLTK